MKQIFQILLNHTEKTSSLTGYQGEFPNLAVIGYQGKHAKNLARCTRKITDDLENFFTLCQRIEETRKQARLDDDSKSLYASYVALDIIHFHIEIRSLMDHVAILLSEVDFKPKQAPASFNDLLSWITKNPSRAAATFDHRILDLVTNCDWFSYLRNNRDNIVHNSVDSQIFSSKDSSILFRIQYIDYKNAFDVDQSYQDFLKYNINDIYFFNRYAPLFIGFVLEFLEQMAAIIQDTLQIEYSNPRKAAIGMPGIDVVREWTKECIIQLNLNG